jgi:hypothetical protein
LLHRVERKTLFAEELGVHYGNGSLFDDHRWGKVGFDIYGDLYDDQPYLEFHVSKLIECCYGIRPKVYVHPKSATLILRALSKKGLKIKENAGLHAGRKTHLLLPEFCREPKNELTAPFVRGLVDIEGSLRLRKQFRNRHYYPVLECEMGDSDFIKSLYETMSTLRMPVNFRVRTRVPSQVTRKTKASFYVSGWTGINAWLNRIGLVNPKHLSKLLVVEKYGFCPPHTSLNERLAIIAGEMNPESFYCKRVGDAVAVPRYRYAHELMILRIACIAQLLTLLIEKMKVRASLTREVLSKLTASRDVNLHQTRAGRVIETSDRGHGRLRRLYRAWEELHSRYGISVPELPWYCPTAFCQKSVN